jgi:hypothetical protein
MYDDRTLAELGRMVDFGGTGNIAAESDIQRDPVFELLGVREAR